MDNSPGGCANNIYSPGSDKLTEVQLYLSTSCQPGSRVIRGSPRISDVDKPFSFSDLAALTAKSENEKGFSMPEKTRISSRGNSHFVLGIHAVFIFQL